MILSKDIAFSELCPIEFTQPKELNFYPEQGEFIGSISNNTFFQCRISQSLYNAPSALNNNEPCSLKVVMRNLDEVLNTFYLSRSKLTRVDAGANNHYYATCWILPSAYVGKAYFEVWNVDELLAESLVYNINPDYDECLKTIQYSHKKNDFETIFNERMTVVDVPVISVPNIISIKLNFATTFNNISFTFASIPNKVYTIKLTDSNGTLYSTNTTLSITTTTFEKTVGTAVNQHGQTLYVEVFDGTTLVAKSELYTFNSNVDGNYYYRTNSFKISIDATFVPSNISLKNKRNDFDKQNYTNNPISSVPYTTEKLTLGTGLGLPNWLAVKLNAIFSLSNTKVGNTQYFVASGANLELRDGSYDGLGIYDIEIQKDNDFLQTDSTSTGIFDNSFDETYN